MRVLRRTPGEWALLAEAVLMTGAASLAIRALPFRRVAKLASGRAARATHAASVAATVRAVETAGRHVPWRAVCFQRGLALHWMLRRRGIASVLHYGVSPPAAGPITAHVWVSVEDEIVLGASGIQGHVGIAQFPSAAA